MMKKLFPSSASNVSKQGLSRLPIPIGGGSNNNNNNNGSSSASLSRYEKGENDYEETLTFCCLRANKTKVQILLNRVPGANVAHKAEWERCSLHWACIAGQLEILQLLLQTRPTLQVEDEDSNTPLHFAAMNGHIALVKELLGAAGAGVVIGDHSTGSPTPLKTVLIHKKNRWGEIPYDLAATEEIKQLLVPTPPRPQRRGENKSLELLDMAEQGQLELIKKWIGTMSNGLINANGLWGLTALHYAALCGQPEMIRVLLAHGARIDSVDDYGWTSLHWACNNGHLDCVTVLLERGANRTIATTRDKKTAADLAVTDTIKHALQSTNMEMFHFLQKHGLTTYAQALATQVYRMPSRRLTRLPSKEITLEILSTLSEEDLKELGLTLGARKKLAKVFHPELNSSNSSFNSSSSNNSDNNNSNNNKSRSVDSDDGTNNSNSSSNRNLTITNVKEQYNNLLLQDVFLTDVQVGERLGGGAFGSVYRGLWNDVTPVALKQLHSGEHMKEFLLEATTLRLLRHPQIVNFLGIYVPVDSPEEQFIVTELMPDGSLDRILRNHSKLPLDNQLTLALDVTAAMIYLASHKMIHRDLAARNVLCKKEGKRYIAKVGDLGLTRLAIESTYHTEGKTFPAKWTAPEALKFGNYTTMSDVWSFGVLLWEIFSDGELPYMGWNNKEAIDQILSGYRLPKPTNCPDEVYKLMFDCWKEDPEQRPNWKDIHRQLQLHLEKIVQEQDEQPGISSDSESLSQFFDTEYDDLPFVFLRTIHLEYQI